MAGKPTRAHPGHGLPSVDFWAGVHGSGQGPRTDQRTPRGADTGAPAIRRTGVGRADGHRSGRLRQHRLLGGRRAVVGLARAIRRRGQQQLYLERRYGRPESVLDPVGQGRPGCGGGAGVGQLPVGQRADVHRLLADGLGERQRRPPALVRPIGAGRRVRRRTVRRVRQRLRRTARYHPVVPGHPVDPLAPTGDRNAADAKASRRRPAAGDDPSRTGADLRRAPRLDGRHAAGSHLRSIRRIRCAASPIAGRHAPAVRSPQRRPTRLGRR